MNTRQVLLYPPLRGVYLDLADVPDPVFAEKMVGDGIALDPLDNVLYAPLSGVVKAIHRSQHAITIAADAGFDILLHVGLETVALGGKGFKIKVAEGDQVKVGTILSEFDLDYLASNARALITPILITDIEEKQLILKILPHGVISDLSQPIIEVTINTTLGEAVKAPPQQETVLTQKISPKFIVTSSSLESELITISNHHGIHARPAAQLNAIARKYPDSEVLLYKGERFANVKSVVSLLSLGIEYQDQIKLVVRGDCGQQIIDEVAAEIAAMHDEPTNLLASEESSSVEPKVENGQYFGTVAANGLALAKLVQQSAAQFKFERFSANVDLELKKLDLVLHQLSHSLKSRIDKLSEFELAHKNILTAHLMILTDPELISCAKNYITHGQSAPYSWEQAIADSCTALRATGNALLIERQSDLRDVRDSVLALLCKAENQRITEYDEDVILVAEDFTPSQICALSTRVKGLVSIAGGTSSHVAILARAKAIPLLVGVSESVLRHHDAKQLVILDANSRALLNCTPSEEEITQVRKSLVQRAEVLELAKQAALLPAVTIDGQLVMCLANIGNMAEARLAVQNGADGVGLFRTEFMFLEAQQAPTEDGQFKEYSKINQLLQDGLERNFTIRTLDVGGDKKLPYLVQPREENPMLGVRGVRLCLAHRELFKTQLRAILRTNSPTVKIMLPMISRLSEYREVKQLVAELKKSMNITTEIQLGIMVEVPAVALLSSAFAKEVDFMSLGTNDLTQYVMAVDREHTELAKEVDHLDPAVLMAIAATARGASEHSTTLSVCGLMASEQLAIPVLLGLGINNLSMTVSTIAENKAFIRRLSLAKCQRIAQHCLGLSTALEVREYLKKEGYAY